jgi:hypothetical protein
MTAQEILDNYRKICDERKRKRCGAAPDAVEAIEALHPFTVSCVARFCADERDLEYIRYSTNPVHLFGDALMAPSSKVPPKEKAAIWRWDGGTTLRSTSSWARTAFSISGTKTTNDKGGQ